MPGWLGLMRIASEVLYEYGVEPTEPLIDLIIQHSSVGDEGLYFNHTEYIRIVESLIVQTETNRLESLTGDKPIAPTRIAFGRIGV